MLGKLILVGAIAILLASNALANECTAPYVGAGTGVRVNTSSGNIGNFRGVPATILAGYGGSFNYYYLAGEFDITVGTAEITNNGAARSTYAYNLSLLPGLMMSDHTVGFGRLGFERTNFSNLSTLKNGVILGIGLQTNVMQNIDVRGEYDYTSFGSITQGATSGTPRTDAVNLALIYKFN